MLVQFVVASILVAAAVVLLLQKSHVREVLVGRFACLAVGGCAWRAAKLHPAEALRD